MSLKERLEELEERLEKHIKGEPKEEKLEEEQTPEERMERLEGALAVHLNNGTLPESTEEGEKILESTAGGEDTTSKPFLQQDLTNLITGLIELCEKVEQEVGIDLFTIRQKIKDSIRAQ